MPEAELFRLLVDQTLDLSSALARELHELTREFDLNNTLANLVWLLDPAAEPVPLRQVAGRLHCDPSNVTLLSDQLEEKGLAERRPHPADRRVRTLVLTPAGEQVRRRLLERLRERSPLAALDEEQQRQLQHLLALALKSRTNGPS